MSSLYGGNSQATGIPSRPGNTGEKVPSGYKKFQLQNFDPNQMALFQQLFSQLGPDSFLSKLAGGDQDTFNQIEAPALKQFSGLQGNIASRFSGMGTGATRSSGFKNTMNQAASDFAGQLQSQRQSLQQQAMQDLMSFSQMLFNQKPYETGLVQKPQKSNALSAFAHGIGGALPGLVTGNFGSGIMNGANNMFGSNSLY